MDIPSFMKWQAWKVRKRLFGLPRYHGRTRSMEAIERRVRLIHETLQGSGHSPRKVLDFGAAEGEVTRRLAERYPQARFVLVEGERKRTRFHPREPRFKTIEKRLDAHGIRALIDEEQPDVALVLSVIHHFQDWSEVLDVFLDGVEHVFVEGLKTHEDERVPGREIEPVLRVALNERMGPPLGDVVATEGPIRPLHYHHRDRQGAEPVGKATAPAAS